MSRLVNMDSSFVFTGHPARSFSRRCGRGDLVVGDPVGQVGLRVDGGIGYVAGAEETGSGGRGLGGPR